LRASIQRARGVVYLPNQLTCERFGNVMGSPRRSRAHEGRFTGEAGATTDAEGGIEKRQAARATQSRLLVIRMRDSAVPAG